MSLSESLLRDLDAEAAITMRHLEAAGSVLETSAEFTPHEKSMTLAALAGHLAETPSWTGAMLEGEWDCATAMEDWKPYVPTSGAELGATFETNMAAVHEMLAGRDDAFMGEDWVMKKAGEEILRQPRHQVIRETILHHSAHHRGQLTVYLRLLGVPVPKSYGPTADFTDF